jgi:hypothetical protein
MDKQERPIAQGMSNLFASVRNQLTVSQGMDDNELVGAVDWRDTN